MFTASRRPLLVAVPCFLAVAVLGFVLGRGPSTPVERTREAATAVGSLDYPSDSGWKTASVPTAVPGLSLAHPTALAPGGNSARGGLVVGRLTESASAPLLGSLVAYLRSPARAEVVYLLNTQAYRYTNLSISGYAEEITLYTIPDIGAANAALVCYASPAYSSDLTECERIVSTFAPSAGGVDDLAPDTGYAREIRAVVEKVDSERAALRPLIRTQAPHAAVQALATALGAGITRAGESLAAVLAPPSVEPAQLALSQALARTSSAYSALAAAAGAADDAAYLAARTQLGRAEESTNAALEDFALLGYG